MSKGVMFGKARAREKVVLLGALVVTVGFLVLTPMLILNRTVRSVIERKYYVTGLTVIEADVQGGDRVLKCRIYKPEELDELEDLFDRLNIRNLTTNLEFRPMMDLMEACDSLSSHVPSTSSTQAANHSKMQTMMHGILPGTFWCGIGDVAQGYDDLGTHAEVDQCCRFHDHCPFRVQGFKNRWGVQNPSIYTKSHCDCDKRFHDCLKFVNTTVSLGVGNFFFNLLSPKCLVQQFPKVCTSRWRNETCAVWEEITSRGKELVVTESGIRY